MTGKNKRTSISKSVRFEVFKRDSFTCQYCGAKSPDVVLVVDHVKPVAGGGDSDIMNLITACQPCNAGKGARELSDKTVIEKQRRQLEELNERREQLEMLISWREGLSDLSEQQIDALSSKIQEDTRGQYLNDHGRQLARKWLKRHSLQDVLDAWDDAFAQYVTWNDDGKAVGVSDAIKYIPRILNVKKRMVDKPYLRDLFYVRGILRNRVGYVNQVECMRLLESAHLAGASIDNLKDLAREVRSWSQFQDELNDFIEEHGDGGA